MKNIPHINHFMQLIFKQNLEFSKTKQARNIGAKITPSNWFGEKFLQPATW